MTAERPTREQIEHILEAATHAPNHHNVQPWKFVVLAGKARETLGEIMAQSLVARLEGSSSEQAQALITKERGKLLRSPVVIVVASEAPRLPKIVEMENIQAVAAAVQNMLLTAEEMGLAAMWRTGDAVYNPHVKEWLGLAADEQIVAFLYLGFPAIPRLERHPTSFADKTVWLGW